MKYNALSLFSSVGIAETYFERNNINLVLANELLEERANFHRFLYPNCEIICGDITNSKIYNEIINTSKSKSVDFIIATPPCQGMSTAGKMLKDDKRNTLIIPTIQIIKELKPKFAIIENVPEQLLTSITVNNKTTLIPDYISSELGNLYNINNNHIVNSMNYGVAQNRSRCVFLLARKDTNIQWEFPEKNKKVLTMKDVIGNLPSLDPNVTDISYNELITMFPHYEEKKENGLKVSKWHYPPRHKLRHVIAMMHTPEGKSAFENEEF